MFVISQKKKRFAKMVEGYSVSYGKRWIAETFFSSIKRTLGEYVYSIRLEKYGKGNDVKSVTV